MLIFYWENRLVKHCIVFRPLSIVDSGIRKIARVFDKGLQSLQEKKDKLMEKSAAIKEKRDAIYGKATATGQNEKAAEEGAAYKQRGSRL